MTRMRSIMNRQAVPIIFLVVFLAVLVAAWALPVSAQKQQTSKAPATFKDVLVQFQGQETNLGLLKKVAGDYIVVEQESDTTLYPIGAIQALKLRKPDEEGGRVIQIKLVAKD